MFWAKKNPAHPPNRVGSEVVLDLTQKIFRGNGGGSY